MHAYRDQYAQLFRDGRNVVLIAISVDPADTLAAWARDDEFQYLFASDTGGVIGKTYGARNTKYGLDNRNLFVVGPDGKIAYRAVPFREIDPTAYQELGAGVEPAGPQPPGVSFSPTPAGLRPNRWRCRLPALCTRPLGGLPAVITPWCP